MGPEPGLRARPADRLVEKARGFGSDTMGVGDGREANAKSTMKIMTLGAKKDASTIIRTGGKDAGAVDPLAGPVSSEEE